MLQGKGGTKPRAMIRRRRFESASHHHPPRGGIIILSLDGSPERRARPDCKPGGYMDHCNRSMNEDMAAVVSGHYGAGFESRVIHHPGALEQSPGDLLSSGRTGPERLAIGRHMTGEQCNARVCRYRSVRESTGRVPRIGARDRQRDEGLPLHHRAKARRSPSPWQGRFLGPARATTRKVRETAWRDSPGRGIAPVTDP